jgi:hypothetical protein
MNPTIFREYDVRGVVDLVTITEQNSGDSRQIIIDKKGGGW